MARYIVGVTGASGIVLAYRCVEQLATAGHEVSLVMSRDAGLTATLEMGAEYGSTARWLEMFEDSRHITVYNNGDFSAPIASGSYRTDGMIIVPCSMATLAAVAMGLCDNLIRRAADVILKERRRLVVVPRETPLSEIHLENMLKLTRAGAVMVPPVPGWYSGHETLEDVENFIVGRTLDALGVHVDCYPRWGGEIGVNQTAVGGALQ